MSVLNEIKKRVKGEPRYVIFMSEDKPLDEKFYKGTEASKSEGGGTVYVEIFQNPTRKELKSLTGSDESSEGVSIFADEKGDVYIWRFDVWHGKIYNEVKGKSLAGFRYAKDMDDLYSDWSPKDLKSAYSQWPPKAREKIREKIDDLFPTANMSKKVRAILGVSSKERKAAPDRI